MRYTDYKQVKNLGKNILIDNQRMILVVDDLSRALKTLKDSFQDDGFEDVEAYVTTMTRRLTAAQASFSVLGEELLAYANDLKAAKGAGTVSSAPSSNGPERFDVQGSDAEKKKRDSARAAAIRAAWEQEAERVRRGMGTRDWTVGQQAELLKYGRVTGFEGQHMYNVSAYPQYAADPNNIQFLTVAEHKHGAHHGGKWKIKTNGRLDVATGNMIPFGEGEPPSVPEFELTDKIDVAQIGFVEGLGRQFGYHRHEDSEEARKRIYPKQKKSD